MHPVCLLKNNDADDHEHAFFEYVLSLLFIPLSLKPFDKEASRITQHLKSLSPIHFVIIRLSNILGNEFLVKLYKLKQNYTFKIEPFQR